MTGCSSISKIGAIGDKEFYSVNVNNFWSKSHSMVVVHDPNDSSVTPASTAVGTGFMSNIFGGAASVGAAYVWGKSLKPNQESTTITGGNSSSNSTNTDNSRTTNRNDNDLRDNSRTTNNVEDNSRTNNNNDLRDNSRTNNNNRINN